MLGGGMKHSGGTTTHNLRSPMNYYDDNTNNAPNANDFLGGNYLGKEYSTPAIRANGEVRWFFMSTRASSMPVRLSADSEFDRLK